MQDFVDYANKAEDDEIGLDEQLGEATAKTVQSSSHNTN